MESTFIKSVNMIEFKGSDEEYHANKEHISASAIKRLKVSPLHYKEQEKIKETDALLFGSAYHCFILEPDKFKDKYYIFDDSVVCGALIANGAKSPRATNDYKAWYKGEVSFSDGKILIDKADYDTLMAMKSRLMNHPYVNMLLKDGRNEVSYMGEVKTECGIIKAKIKPDHINEGKKIIVDLKTCIDASIYGFSRHAAELDYHIQASFYSDIMEKITGDDRAYTFFFIAQEKKAPYAFNLFESSPQFISQGRYEYEMLLQLYKYCIDNNKWPGYQVFCQNRYGINELKLPNWATKDLTYYTY